jgi:catechol 2,3-dioxygenase-like lactoylglutathione lyase family enzyme
MSSLLVHVGVRATDIDRTIVFWRDALGFKVAARIHENCYDLTDGYHNFRLFKHEGPDRPPHIGGMLDYLHIGVRVPDLHVAAKRCRDLGFEIIWEGLDGKKRYDPERPPAEAFKVEDPDGIVVDVTEREDQWPGVRARNEFEAS